MFLNYFFRGRCFYEIFIKNYIKTSPFTEFNFVHSSVRQTVFFQMCLLSSPSLLKAKTNTMFQKFKVLLFILTVVTFTFTSCEEHVHQETETATNQEETTQEQEPMAEKLLRHVVLFKFKDEAPAEEVEKIHQSFNALPTAIPEIHSYEWGMNDSPEDFHQGFTHCYLLTFKSEEDRDSVYTPHPAHKAFVASLQPHLEKVFVVDYWANAVE